MLWRPAIFWKVKADSFVGDKMLITTVQSALNQNKSLLSTQWEFRRLFWHRPKFVPSNLGHVFFLVMHNTFNVEPNPMSCDPFVLFFGCLVILVFFHGNTKKK